MESISRNRSVIQKLESLLENPTSQEMEIDTLATLAWELRMIYPERSRRYARKVATLAQSGDFEASPYIEGSAAAAVALAFFYMQTGQLHETTRQCLSALKILEGSPHTKTTLHIWLILANNSFFLGGFETALKNAQKTLNLAEELGLVIEKAWALDITANAYGIMGEYEKAFAAHHKAMDIFRVENDIDGILRAGNNIAMTLYQKGDLEEAYEQILKTRELAQERKRKSDLLNIHCTAAQIAIDLSLLDEAEEHLLAAFSNGEVLEYTHTYHVFVIMEWGRLSLKRDEVNKAKSYYLQALVLAEENDQIAEMAQCYQELSSIYAQEGDTERAEKYMEQVQFFSDELERKLTKHRKIIKDGTQASEN